MEIKVIEGAFSVCRLKELGQAMIEDDLYFLGRTVFCLNIMAGRCLYGRESWEYLSAGTAFPSI